MEFSDLEEGSVSQDVMQQVVSLTGLPESWIRLELDPILESLGQNKSQVTLDQLRQTMLAYLELTQEDFLSTSPFGCQLGGQQGVE